MFIYLFLVDSYEFSSRSTEQFSKRSGKTNEGYVKEHVSDEPEDLEQELHQRILIMKSRMDQQLSSIGKVVVEQAPKKNDPDYQTKAARYREFLADATSGLQTMSD